MALHHRLSQQGLVASPARGYYVVLPPEYYALGCLPAEQFVPSLMERLGLRDYAGLLTAAHGAAHQKPQESKSASNGLVDHWPAAVCGSPSSSASGSAMYPFRM